MPAATNPTFTLGSLSFNAAMTKARNFYKIENTDDLWNAPATRKSDTPLQGMHGTDDSLTFYGPRTIAVEGELHADSPSVRVTMEQAMRKQLALPADQDYATRDGYQLLQFTDEDGVAKQIYAKCIDGPFFKRMKERMEWARSFRFTLYAKDPTIYSQTLSTANGAETVVGTNFSVIQGVSPSVPFSLIQTTADTLTATNAGIYQTAPLIIVSGPTQSPAVKNVTTGKTMDFTGLTLLSGETLEIDVAASTITKVSSGVRTDASGYLNTAISNWIYLYAGANEFTLIDSSPDAIVAQLEIRWRNAWM